MKFRKGSRNSKQESQYDAMKVTMEVESIYKEMGDKAGLVAATLIMEANDALIRRQPEIALEMYRAVERMCRDGGVKDGLQHCLRNQAAVLAVQGDGDGAMQLLKEAEDICWELSNKDGLKQCLSQHILSLIAKEDLDGAMRLLTEATHREPEIKDSLLKLLFNGAVQIQELGVLDLAHIFFQGLEHIYRELNEKELLSYSLNNHANVQKGLLNLDEALKLQKEAESVCRELGDKEGVAMSLSNQALALEKLGRIPDALALAQEAYQMAKRNGFTDIAQASKETIDILS